MSKVYTAPKVMPDGTHGSIFLAGSIENGAAENWQQKVMDDNVDVDVVFVNPRRSSWDPEAKPPAVRKQIRWELNHLVRADVVLFYFQPGTMSPISLLELGIMTENPFYTTVVCPDGFWRADNVRETCKHFNIYCTKSLKAGVKHAIAMAEYCKGMAEGSIL